VVLFERNGLFWRLSFMREGTNTAEWPVDVEPTARESATIFSIPES